MGKVGTPRGRTVGHHDEPPTGMGWSAAFRSVGGGDTTLASRREEVSAGSVRVAGGGENLSLKSLITSPQRSRFAFYNFYCFALLVAGGVVFHSRVSSRERSKMSSTGATKGGRGKPKAFKEVSRSQKASLQFPVGLKVGKYSKCIDNGAPNYLSLILEYLAAEVLELAGNAAKDNKKNRIVPRHIQLGVRNDEELRRLLGMMTIISDGVLPNTHLTLLPKKQSDRKGEIGSASQEF
ncbi:hypothetical protein Taro_014008 [Colocasia esculenta]|uniref:Histone H2A n=1 Tax=Colocasia esculenta TaxID=4460 RepID=A0A843UHS4_COLES|nr:hypothetical protein [Colocasia esculenta]